jgi:hypothetical protein
MLNAVELDGMVQQHVVMEQHVHMEMITIGNVYQQEDHHHLQVEVSVQQQ